MLDLAVEEGVRRMLANGSNDQAATVLIRGYGPRILGYLRAILRDEDLAGDAFSRFGEQIWRGVGGFRGEGSALAWGYSVAWRAVCRVVDSGYQRRHERLDTTEAGRLVAEVHTKTRPYLRTDLKDAVARLREQLSRDEQTLLFLHVDQGLSWHEVATAMAVDAATLRKRFERIKDKLRALAEEAGLLED